MRNTQTPQTPQTPSQETLQLTILMPCLNEEKTIGACIDEAAAYLSAAGCTGEILISDNGSSDRSASIARNHGACVITCPQKGYGNALRYGLREAKGTFVIFGDCDLSYDFLHLEEMHRLLKDGCDLVIGDRFATPPVATAMPFSHRWGVPLLSFLGRMRYGCHVKDFHCGLRGCRKSSMERLDLKAPGMEFATEIIAKASAAGLKIGQTPIILHPDGREGKPHLRTFRDGFRHLKFMMRPLDKR
ncbi:MAG: glycosyltransferase family 2 protein [Bacillota bacterium]|nr:glycosyltransferase family 2 protein [Bacillota bacterium]